MKILHLPLAKLACRMHWLSVKPPFLKKLSLLEYVDVKAISHVGGLCLATQLLYFVIIYIYSSHTIPHVNKPPFFSPTSSISNCKSFQGF